MSKISKKELRRLNVSQLEALRVEYLEINKPLAAETIDKIIEEKRNGKYFNPRTGKDGRDWNKVRNQLKKISLTNNQMYCQFRFEGCWGQADGYSHPVKVSRGGKHEGCVLSCNWCHDLVENHEDKIRLHEEARERSEQAYYQSA